MKRKKSHDYDGILSPHHLLILKSRFPWVLLVLTLLSLLLLHLNNPYQISDSAIRLSHYTKQLLQDEAVRVTAENHVRADLEHELYLYQTKYRDSHCRVGDDDVSKYDDVSMLAWLTVVGDDDVSVVQALVLGHVLQKLSCVRERVAGVRHFVSEKTRDILTKAGFKVVQLPDLNCDGSDGKHVVLGAWNLTQYSRIVYLDTANIPILSIDEVFDTIHPDKITSPFPSPPGVADTSFSGAMFGFSPRSETYQNMLDMFQKRSYYKCPDVPDFLWHYFSERDNWVRLPYSYNVRNDRYFPMKGYHFGAVNLRLGYVWEWKGKPTRQQADKLETSLYTLEDLYSFWWKMLYEGLEESGLWHWWHYESSVYHRFLHSDPVRDFRAVDIY